MYAVLGCVSLAGAVGMLWLLVQRNEARSDLAACRKDRDSLQAQLTGEKAGHEEDTQRYERVIADKDRLVGQLRDDLGQILGQCGDASAGAAAVGAYLTGVLQVPKAGRGDAGGRVLPLPAPASKPPAGGAG